MAASKLAFSSGEREIDYLSCFAPMMELLRKIGVWWIVNVELETDPEWADKEIDESGIVPGPVMMLQMMMDIALGEPDQAEYYIQRWRELQQKHYPATNAI